MKKTNKKNKGFTLIEMMVVLGIIGLIIAITGFSALKNINRKKAEAVAKQIQQAVQLARDFSLTGEVVNDALPEYFYTEIDDSAHPVKITIMASGGTSTGREYILQEFETSNQLELRGVANFNTYQYKTPNGDFEDCTSSPCKLNVCASSACTGADVYTITFDAGNNVVYK